MPEINTVSFRYEPVNGDLLVDPFRMHFHVERVDDVRETLQYLCFAFDAVREIEGEIRFSTADDEPPSIRDMRYATPKHRGEYGRPFPENRVRLWPA